MSWKWLESRKFSRRIYFVDAAVSQIQPSIPPALPVVSGFWQSNRSQSVTGCWRAIGPAGHAGIRRELPQRFHLLRPGFLLEILRHEVRSRTALDPRGETISSQNAGAADAAESVRGALHQSDEPVPLKDVVSGNLNGGQKLNSRRGEPLQFFLHYIL